MKYLIVQTFRDFQNEIIGYCDKDIEAVNTLATYGDIKTSLNGAPYATHSTGRFIIVEVNKL